MPDLTSSPRRRPNLTWMELPIYLIAIVGMGFLFLVVATSPVRSDATPSPTLTNLELPDGRTLECVTFEGKPAIISCDWAGASK